MLLLFLFLFIKYIFTKEDPLLTLIIVLEKYTFIMTRIVPAFERNNITVSLNFFPIHILIAWLKQIKAAIKVLINLLLSHLAT